MIDQPVQTNIIRSVLFKVKTSYRIVKSDSVGDAAILVHDTQADFEENYTTAKTIIHS